MPPAFLCPLFVPCALRAPAPVNLGVRLLKKHMTITSFRIYFEAQDEQRKLRLNQTHWGFAQWFERRLKTIKEHLKGPEVKGVNIVNIMLHEVPEHAWHANEWHRRMNTFEFSFVCDLRPLEDQPSINNIELLMPFASAVCALSPWPQVRAIADVLSQPLTNAERESLKPFLVWPRELFAKNSYRLIK
jgi:hypothetical protein